MRVRSVTALAFVALALPSAGAEQDAPPAPDLGVARSHPDLPRRLGTVRKVGVLEPRIDVFELAAGGHRALQGEWSARARKLVAESVAGAIQARGFAVEALASNPSLDEELADARLLYEAVEASIVFAVYQQKFPARVERFEYSIGDASKLLDGFGVDALAIVYGSDEVSSGGRKAALAVSSAALALLGFVAIPRGGVTRMNVALVDRSGAVLWFNVAAGSYDLRDPSGAGALVAALLAGWPTAPAR